MIEDDDFDFRVICNAFQASEKVVGKAFFHGVDHRHAFAAANHISVVTGTVGSLQDDVEGAQVRVQRADPMHAFG